MIGKGDDPLNAEIKVSVELTKNGAQVSAWSRLLAAADRLGGNLVDYFNPGLEHRARIARAKTDGDVQLTAALAKAAASEIVGNPAYVRKAIENHLQHVLAESQNVDAVLLEAANRATTICSNRSTDEPIDDDWLAAFRSYAGKANSDWMRQVLGHVLAGEAANPGSFQLTTIRVLAELDSRTARAFEAGCSKSFFDGTHLLALSFEGLGPRMVDSGLIRSLDHKLLAFGTNRPEFFNSKSLGTQVGNASIAVAHDTAPNAYLGAYAFELTGAGIEIASLFDLDEMAIFNALMERADWGDGVVVRLYNLQSWTAGERTPLATWSERTGRRAPTL